MSASSATPIDTASSRSSAGVAAVTLEHLVKRFGDDEVGRRVAQFVVRDGTFPVTAVNGIDLEIADGEFFSMLGPSGSGKTTTLRMIAGFESPSEGRILLHGKDVTGIPPFDRDVNTVFQDYALFPHMTVGENVAYGLMVRRTPAAERTVRTKEALRMVRLEGYEKRRPAQLSGGQRQRVALARALVNRPRVLLLDEPLGALDLKLREEMQIELKAIQAQVGITFIYVTHDQEEALVMSDRIAVFNRGRIEQVGTPADVYEHPSTTFVAGFVGTSNLLQGAAARTILGMDGTFTVRPEKVRLGAPADEVAGDQHSALGRIEEVVYLGADTRYIVALDAGGQLIVTQQNLVASSMEALAAQGRVVRLIWQRQHVLALRGGTNAMG
ncbi:MAG: ABC transporter ATP-binding protein, partial [Candidatus Limnocylindria bacterium]